MVKSQGKVLLAFHKEVMNKTANPHPELEHSAEKLQSAANEIVAFASQNADNLELAARDFAYSIGRTFMGKIA